MKERYALLSDYRTLCIGKVASSETKIILKISQLVVDDTIALAKTVSSTHQSETINSMLFNHKEAWESVRVLSGGDKSHHASPTAIWM